MRTPIFQRLYCVIRPLRRSFFFLATCVVAGLLLNYGNTLGVFDTSFANTYIKNKGFLGIFLFFVLVAGASAVGMPRQLLSTAAGYAFGVLAGTFIVTLAVVVGGAVTFYYARLLGREALQKKFGTRIAKIEQVLLKKPFLMTVAIRLLPAGNNLLTNVFAGLSTVPAASFFSGSFVGQLPQNAIFVLLGSGIAFGSTELFMYSFIFFCISATLGVWMYMALRKNMPEDIIETVSNTSKNCK